MSNHQCERKQGHIKDGHSLLSRDYVTAPMLETYDPCPIRLPGILTCSSHRHQRILPSISSGIPGILTVAHMVLEQVGDRPVAAAAARDRTSADEHDLPPAGMSYQDLQFALKRLSWGRRGG